MRNIELAIIIKFSKSKVAKLTPKKTNFKAVKITMPKNNFKAAKITLSKNKSFTNN